MGGFKSVFLILALILMQANTGRTAGVTCQLGFTADESCCLGVQAEIENADMYVGLLAGTTNYPDVQSVFKRLRDASLYQHLPAFQKCAD